MQFILDSVHALARHYPPWFQAEIAEALPALRLEAMRLALEVMQAERDNIPYADAVRRVDFPLMGRVHFGLEDLLQHRLPPFLREAIRSLIGAARCGEFDELRRAMFDGAANDDPQAALLRFLLYEGARFDLMVATWDIPELEVVGALARVDREAQRILQERLAMPHMHAPDVRPLHVLWADLALHAFGDAEAATQSLQDPESIGLVQRLTEITRIIRGLDAAYAAVARADAFSEEMGSQQLVDRYPWHFSTSNAVDKRRSRLRQAVSEGRPPVVTDGSRLVDLIQGAAREEEE